MYAGFLVHEDGSIGRSTLYVVTDHKNLQNLQRPHKHDLLLQAGQK